MAFSLFNEDEKSKITDSFNSLGIPQETIQTTDFMSYDSKDDDRKKLDDEIIAKNKALEDIISNQRMEENQIKDDYDSLGSRANRFLQVFGAGLRGDNASQVAQSLSDRLDKRLQGAQARYKDQRDSAYTQYKDLLARREALNKADYDRQRDQAKDQQWEQEFGLKTKTQADQNAIQKAQLDILRNQATDKKNQETQALQNQEKLEDASYDNLEKLGQFALDPQYFKKLSDSGRRAKGSEIYFFNTKVAEAMGIKPQEAAKWIESNPSLPRVDDTYTVSNQKMTAILNQLPGANRAKARKQEAIKQDSIAKTKELIDTANPGSFISFPSMPNEQFLVTADKTLFKDGKEYKFDETGRFVEVK